MRPVKSALAAGALALGLAVTGCANQLPALASHRRLAATPPRSTCPRSTRSLCRERGAAQGDGKGKCAPTTTIGYVGAMTGPNAQLGINIYNGIQQAIDEHNGNNPDCGAVQEARHRRHPDKAPAR